jgi:hypothetical protein
MSNKKTLLAFLVCASVSVSDAVVVLSSAPKCTTYNVGVECTATYLNAEGAEVKGDGVCQTIFDGLYSEVSSHVFRVVIVFLMMTSD